MKKKHRQTKLVLNLEILRYLGDLRQPALLGGVAQETFDCCLSADVCIESRPSLCIICYASDANGVTG